MMRVACLTTLLFTCGFHIYAQCGLDGLFQLSMKSDALAMEVNSQGMLYTVSHDYGSGSVWCIARLEKRSPSGEILESFLFKNHHINDEVIISDMTFDQQDNIYVCGYWEGDIDFDGHASYTCISGMQFFAAKLTSDLDLLWVLLNPASDSGVDIAYSITVDTLGSCFIGGVYQQDFSCGSTTLPYSPSKKSFIARVNSSSGDVLWCISENFMYPHKPILEVDYSGGIYATHTEFNTDNILVEKYDSTGQHLWSLTGTGGENFFNGASTSDNQGNLIILGTLDDTLILGGTTLTNLGHNGIFLGKISPAGEVDLQRLATTAYGNDLVLVSSSLHFLNESGYYISGYCSGETNFKGIPVNVANEKSFFVGKFDAIHSPVWAASFANQESYRPPAGARFSNDCNVFFFGNHKDTVSIDTTLFVAPPFENRRLLVEIDNSTGHIVFGPDYLNLAESVVSEITIYPNPSDGRFYLNCNFDTVHDVRIFAMTGNLVYHEPVVASNYIETNLLPGTYILSYQTDKKSFLTKLEIIP